MFHFRDNNDKIKIITQFLNISLRCIELKKNIFSDVMFVKFVKDIMGLKEEIYSAEEWKAHSRSEIGMLRTTLFEKNYNNSLIVSEPIEAKITKILFENHVLNQNYTEPQHEKIALKVRDFLENMVTYFFEICALFRRQIFDINHGDGREFIFGIFKEIFIPQLVLILYSDIFFQKTVNLNTNDFFSPGNGYYELQKILPINSPLYHLAEFLFIAIEEKKAKNQQINFSSISREYCKEILKCLHRHDAYQEFKTNLLDKLTFKQIPNFGTLKSRFKSLRNKLRADNSINTQALNLDDVLSCAFGVMVCGTALERVRKILIHDFKFTDNQFEDFIQYFYKLVFCVLKVSGYRSDSYDFEILQCNKTFLNKCFPNLDSKDFPDKNKISKRYLLPNNANFINLVTLNCIFNNNPQILTHSKYSEELKNNAQQNLTKSVDYELESNELAIYTAGSYQHRVGLNYYDVAKQDISWDTTSFLDISTVLYESIKGLETYNFYLPLKAFSNCLFAFINNDIDTAKKEIKNSFDLIKTEKQTLHLGGYTEHILAFYLGLRAFSKAPNSLEIKKLIRYSLPIASENMSVSIAQAIELVSKEIGTPEDRQDLYVSVYILYVLGKFNHMCIKKNRYPDLANNPYEKVLFQFRNFISTVIANQAQGNDLEQCWKTNKPLIKNKKIFLDKTVPYIKSNIVNVLKNPNEHFAIFNSLYLDAHNDSRYIYHLLQEKSADLRSFILNKIDEI